MQSPVGMQPKNPMSFLKIVPILYRIGTFLRSTEIDNSCVGALIIHDLSTWLGGKIAFANRAIIAFASVGGFDEKGTSAPIIASGTIKRDFRPIRKREFSTVGAGIAIALVYIFLDFF